MGVTRNGKPCVGVNAGLVGGFHGEYRRGKEWRKFAESEATAAHCRKVRELP